MSQPTPSHPPNTVSIGAGRFEQSPYYVCYATPDTVFGVAAERFYPADIGEDKNEIYQALRSEAALFDVPEKPWQIEGPDVVPFLERIFARRVGDLPEGRGRYAIACTAEGGTYMDGILFRLGENRFWYVQPDGAFEQWLLAHRAGFDVTITDPRSRVLQLQGPNSMRIMADATGGAIDDGMKYFAAGFFDIGGQRLYVSRTGWTGEMGYEIYSDGATTDHPRLWNDLFEAGAPHGMVFGGLAAMGIRRIEAGILDNLSDFDPSMTPFEAGLGAFIDLDKDHDFIGRDALRKADRRTRLYGIKCVSTRPVNGAEILGAGGSVGRLTAAAWSPGLECGIGIVRFDQPGDWAGRTLSMKTPRDELADCEVLKLPFYDREKRIPRGLATSDD